MNTVKVKLEIPEDIISGLKETEKEIENDAKISIAIWFYINEKITLAKAARLAGISKNDLEKILSEKQIPISLLNIKDINDELKSLKKL